MKITTREYDKYINIEVEIDSTKIDLGFNDVPAAQAILDSLSNATYEIEEYIKKHFDPNI